MKCMSCDEEVSPKFGHAIAKNECPYCGKVILDPKLQELLASLKILMDSAKDFLPQVEDWLFSNYSLKKHDPNEMPTTFNFSTPNKKPGKGISVRRAGEDNSSDEVETTQFAKRSGVKQMGMTAKQVLDKIKGNMGVITDPSQLESEDEIIDIPGTTENLSEKDQRDIVDVFDTPVSQELEMQKLKKLQNQLQSTGSFRRE